MAAVALGVAQATVYQVCCHRWPQIPWVLSHRSFHLSRRVNHHPGYPGLSADQALPPPRRDYLGAGCSLIVRSRTDSAVFTSLST